MDWSTGDLANAVLYSIPIGSLINSGVLVANPNQVTYWYEKIKGFSLMRGTFVIRVIMNANPFQAGALLGHFLPCQTTISAIDASYTGTHNVNLTTKSQQPGFILTCEDTSVVMEIPYIAPTHWYNFTDGSATTATTRYDWGTFYLSVLSTLLVGAGQDTTVPIAIYGYWKDVELAAPMVPQMAGGNAARTNIRKVSKKNNAERENDAMESKPISSALMVASKAATTLSAIPVLSPVMNTASWALSLAGGLASAFGWSKPVTNSVSTVVTNQYNRYVSTSDGPDTSYPLSLISSNTLVPKDDLSVYPGDEMSTAFLYSREALIDSFYWPTSTGTNSSLYRRFVSPDTTNVTGTKVQGATTFTYATGPPVYYLSRSFRKWRGSMKLNLHFIKTMYHTGRLQVTWTPSNVSTTNVDVFNSLYSLREVIDIRDGNKFEFTLPWLLEYDYLGIEEYSGILEIRIINELRAPTTASQTIQCLVFMSGGEDFELQAPIFTSGVKSVLAMPFSTQMDVSPSTTGAIANASTSPQSLTSSVDCMGEHFTSVKQILNRATYLAAGTFTSGATMYPWLSTMLYAFTGLLTGQTVGGDAFTRIAPMYAFFRGGVNVHFQYPSNTVAGFVSSALLERPASATIFTGGTNLITNPGATYDWRSTTNSVGSFGSRSLGNLQGNACSTTVPYYCSTRMSLVLNNTISAAAPTISSQPITFLSVSSNASGSVSVMRSFKDDFQLMYFVGCPPTYLGSA